MSLKRDLEFLYEIGCIRFINRVWVQLLGPNFANNAEHTFRVVWIAMIIAKNEGVKDVGKVAKMALVHDLPESRTGDVHYISRIYTKRREDEAIKDILANTSLQEFVHIWEEYEQRKSIESKIVKDADNLDVDLELREQESKGVTLKEAFKEHRTALTKTLYTKTAKKIWKAIQKSSPHDWHLNAKNRFTAGDWKHLNKKAKKKHAKNNIL